MWGTEEFIRLPQIPECLTVCRLFSSLVRDLVPKLLNEEHTKREQIEGRKQSLLLFPSFLSNQGKLVSLCVMLVSNSECLYLSSVLHAATKKAADPVKEYSNPSPSCRRERERWCNIVDKN